MSVYTLKSRVASKDQVSDHSHDHLARKSRCFKKSMLKWLVFVHPDNIKNVCEDTLVLVIVLSCLFSRLGLRDPSTPPHSFKYVNRMFR